jgi:hypothetical protein
MRVCRSDGLGYCFVQSLQQRQYKNYYKTKYLQWKIMNQEQKQIMRMIRKHKKMNKFKQADKQKECCLQF